MRALLLLNYRELVPIHETRVSFRGAVMWRRGIRTSSKNDGYELKIAQLGWAQKTLTRAGGNFGILLG